MNPLSDVEGSGVRFFNRQYRQKCARPVVHTPMLEGCLQQPHATSGAALFKDRSYVSVLQAVGRCAAHAALRAGHSSKGLIGSH